MSLTAFESSRNRGAPAELYQFRYGTDSGAFFAYTDIESAITFMGITFEPLPIKRSKIVSSGRLDKAALTVEAPLSSGVVELFRVFPPSQPVALTIWAGHATDTDTDFAVVWTGRVLNVSRSNENGPVGTITCEPASTSLRRVGMRRHYQLSCPHVLYGTRCRVVRADRTVDAVATLVDYTKIGVNDGWSGVIDPLKYVGGIAQWESSTGTEQRTILRVDTSGIAGLDVFALSGPTSGLTTGMTVSLSLGCNHQTSDCETLHDNIVNYGGQNFIPLKNPIKTNPFT